MKKDIAVNDEGISCDVCGRTLLKGERTEIYLTAAGERRSVCDLCRTRVEHQGWLRESVRAEVPTRRTHRRAQKRSLMSIFSRKGKGKEQETVIVQETAEELEPAAKEEEEVKVKFDAAETVIGTDSDLNSDEQPTESGSGESESDLQVTNAEAEQKPDRSKQPKKVIRPDARHVRAVPTNAELKIERALEIFGSSEHPRTVSGIAKTLGSPQVSVTSEDRSPSVVTLVIAWELSWYQFSIDLGDSDEPVELKQKGYELEEIPESLKTWNAQMDEHGHISI